MIKRLKEENRIENKLRKGRPRKLTKHNERFIIRKYVKKRRLSEVEVSEELNGKFSTSISHKTIRRVHVSIKTR